MTPLPPPQNELRTCDMFRGNLHLSLDCWKELSTSASPNPALSLPLSQPQVRRDSNATRHARSLSHLDCRRERHLSDEPCQRREKKKERWRGRAEGEEKEAELKPKAQRETEAGTQEIGGGWDI